jgi:hypothetical protein
VKKTWDVHLNANTHTHTHTHHTHTDAHAGYPCHNHKCRELKLTAGRDARLQCVQVASVCEADGRTRLSNPTAQYFHHEERSANASYPCHIHKSKPYSQMHRVEACCKRCYKAAELSSTVAGTEGDAVAGVSNSTVQFHDTTEFQA